MLTIKLSRVGKKKQASFRMIVTEKSKDPYGNSLEILGHYNPRTKEAVFKEERIKYWLSKGAQSTNTAHNLLIAKGIINEKKKRAYRLTKRRLEKITGKKKEDDSKEAAKTAATK